MCSFASLIVVSQSTSKFMRANLYAVTSPTTKVLVDGNFTQYDNSYSNAVDIQDVWKMTNTGENFGIIRDGYTLVMERRKDIAMSDTSYFRMWNLQQRDYLLEIITKNITQPDLVGTITDAFSGTSTEILLNDTTRIAFTVTADPATYAANRFKMEYETVLRSTLPVVFSSISTSRKNSGILLNWKVSMEDNVDYYAVERSSNNNGFEQIATQDAINNGNSQNYTYFDRNIFRGNHIYRVKAVFRDGHFAYSENARALIIGQISETITVYPNPVLNKKVQIQFSNAEKMNCRISFINSDGKEVWSEKTTLPAGANRTVQLPQHIQSGIYRCIISDLSGIIDSKTIIVL